jgi:hydrogenase nickel incorporation protein HypB
MRKTCGSSSHLVSPREPEQSARVNRAWLARRAITLINLFGAPGAGKTTLLEATVRLLRERLPLAVLEADPATSLDAERMQRTGCRALQINTGAGCHLDAAMVQDGLARLDPAFGTVVFAENVGNLVCPAYVDIGERAKVVLMSVTEGADKPLKYPQAFRAAELLVLTKMDLVRHVDFELEQYLANVRSVNPELLVLRVSARSGEGMPTWSDWLWSLLEAAPQRAFA